MTDRRPPYDQNETPEDVATLYSWANLHGAKYRDFSASRAQTREQVRLRVQQALEAEQAAAPQPASEPSRITPPEFDASAFPYSAMSQSNSQPNQPVVTPPVSFHPEANRPEPPAELFPGYPSYPNPSHSSPSYVDAGRIDYRTEADRAAEVLRAAEAARMAEQSRKAELMAQFVARKAAEQAAAEQAAREQAEEAARQAAEEAAAKHAAEEAARREAEEAAARHAAEEAARREAEEAAKRETEEAAARHAAEEAARQEAEEAARREAEEAAARQAAEEAARQQAEEAAKRETEEAAARQAAEESARQQAEEAAKQQAEEAARMQAEAEAKHAAEETARQEAAEQAARESAAREASERAVHEAAQQAEAARQALAAQWAAQRSQAVPPLSWPALHSSPSTSVPPTEQPASVQSQAPPPPFDYPAYAYAHRPTPAASRPSAPFESPLQESAQVPREAAAQIPAQAPSHFAGQPSAQIPPHGAAPISDPFEPAERPAWLSPDRPDFPSQPVVTQAPEDTLQGSRDRLTSRWYALRGVFDSLGTPVEATPAPAPARAPVVAIFSLAGGVGKTSMVATMGRALSSRGERVLLVDTAAYGLLPFFFGAHDQRPGQLRTFSPPGTSTDAPIQMVTIDPDSLGSESTNQEALCSEIGKYSRGVSRVIVDLATASGATTRRVLKMAPLVVVPMVPDMNSVVSVSSIDSFFQHNPNPAMKSAMPHYVLNQFDPSLPLHLDIREVLREQLGERLLPFVIRRAAAVSEALAEGMTVMDYAPNSTVAEDFGTLAGWVKTQSAPASSTYRGVRWSER